jgi:GAF domain-containing protein
MADSAAGRPGAVPRGAGPAEIVSPMVEVAFLDRAGVIEWVNGAWDEFCRQNGGDPSRVGVGVSYLSVCDAAADDPAAAAVGEAIRTAIGGELASPVTVQIACDSPSAARWFDVLIAPRDDVEGNLVGASVSLAVSTAPEHARAPGVLRAQDRLRALIRAIDIVTGDLTLHVLLRHLAEAARELGEARYAGVRIEAGDGAPETSVAVGIDDDPDDARGDISGHLSVPIRLRETELGVISLARSRRGGFNNEDEQLVIALATSAAVAIRNAHRYEHAERRRHWQEAATATAQALIVDVADPAEVVLEHARRAADGDRAELARLGDDDRVYVEATVGDAGEVPGPPVRLDDSPAGPVLREGTPVHVEDATSAVPSGDRSGSMLVVPITSACGRPGALSVARRAGRARFDGGELDHLTEFARQAGHALELHRARAGRERSTLIEEHDRIAAALHDRVIPDLFATGIGLQAMVHDLDRPDQRARILQLVEDVDATIRHIRTTVYLSTDAR